MKGYKHFEIKEGGGRIVRTPNILKGGGLIWKTFFKQYWQKVKVFLNKFGAFCFNSKLCYPVKTYFLFLGMHNNSLVYCNSKKVILWMGTVNMNIKGGWLATRRGDSKTLTLRERSKITSYKIRGFQTPSPHPSSSVTFTRPP